MDPFRRFLQELHAALAMGAKMVPRGGDFALAAVLKQCDEELTQIGA